MFLYDYANQTLLLIRTLSANDLCTFVDANTDLTLFPLGTIYFLTLNTCMALLKYLKVNRSLLYPEMLT